MAYLAYEILLDRARERKNSNIRTNGVKSHVNDSFSDASDINDFGKRVTVGLKH